METRSQQADKIIQHFAFGSSLAGFIPVPLLDAVGLIGVQRFMLYRLSKLYSVPFKKNLGKAMVTTSFAGLTSAAATPVVGKTLLKFIPGVGTVVGAMSMAALGSASTYAVGKVFQQHFEKGGTLENFDPKLSEEAYKEALKKGQELAEKKT